MKPDAHRVKTGFCFRLRDDICQTLSAVDGAETLSNGWRREAGGGGHNQVLRNGGIFEQAGVNFSPRSRRCSTRVRHRTSARTLAGRGPDDGRGRWWCIRTIHVYSHQPC